MVYSCSSFFFTSRMERILSSIEVFKERAKECPKDLAMMKAHINYDALSMVLALMPWKEFVVNNFLWRWDIK